MAERVLLTPRRREILEGTRDEDPDSIRVAKYKLRKRVHMALDEFKDLAESDGIDNEDLFPPDEIREFIMALFGDYEEIQPYHEAWEAKSGEAVRDYMDEHDYEISLAEVINHMDTVYADLLLNPDPPRSSEERFRDTELLNAVDHEGDGKRLYVDQLEKWGWELVEGTP